MPEDWNTINLSREQAVGREIEHLRARYLQHMATLEKLITEAPTDHLAGEYERVRQEVELSLHKLNELESGIPAAQPVNPKPAVPSPPARTSAKPQRPEDDPFYQTNPSVLLQRDSPLRALAIVLIGFVVLSLSGYFFWRYLQGRPGGRSDSRSTASSSAPVETATLQEIVPVASSGFTISPPSQDFGRIRRGTRATRQFELTNNTDAEIPLAVSRSNCKCLWFEYVPLPPGGSTTLTVTIDATRAPRGTLRETVKVSSKTDQKVSENLEVIAVIQ